MFKDCTLYISARSPFARRIRLALLECEIPFRLKVLDVLKPNAELISINPLGRVPTVILQSGETLVESGLILNTFYRHHPSSYFPTEPKTQLQLYFWMGLASGIADKSIEYFFENQRSSDQRDSEWINEIALVTDKTFERFERRLAEGPFLVGDHLTQADFDLGIAMEYFSLRVNSTWEQKFPLIAQAVSRLRSRTHFEETRPPT